MLQPAHSVYGWSRGRFPVKSLSKPWFVTGGSRDQGRRGKRGMRRETRGKHNRERKSLFRLHSVTLGKCVPCVRARACVCVCVHTLVRLWPRSRLLPCGLGEKWRVNARTRRVRHSRLKGGCRRSQGEKDLQHLELGGKERGGRWQNK